MRLEGVDPDEDCDPPPMRGDIAVTASMEVLQIAYLHAVAAAAGCSLSRPHPDRGVDWNVSHASDRHVVDPEADLKIQLKSTYQRQHEPRGPSFAFPLENEHLAKLNWSPPTITRILVVMIIPRTVDHWITADKEHLKIRHCCYWANLEGVPARGKQRTSVNVSWNNRFDHLALCRIMEKIGRGETPR